MYVMDNQGIEISRVCDVRVVRVHIDDSLLPLLRPRLKENCVILFHLGIRGANVSTIVLYDEVCRKILRYQSYNS